MCAGWVGNLGGSRGRRAGNREVSLHGVARLPGSLCACRGSSREEQRMQRLLRMRRARMSAVLLPILGMLALAGCVGGPGGDPSGALEVCKSGANGMQGTAFQFSIDNGAPFTVNGGSCSGLRQGSSQSGTHTITEIPAANTSVVDVQVVSGAPASLNGNTETVTVSNDGTAAHETRVTFVNAGPGPGLLKVCKQSADPTLQGSGFSFTENGGPAFTVNAGPIGSANCDGGTSYQAGTLVNVHELIPTNVHVSAIDVSNGRGGGTDLANGNVTATVGAGTTIVTYTDQVNAIIQTGFVEVCKDAGDRFVNGWFDFTVTGPGQSLPVSVMTGQCSGPLQVPAGNVTIAEANRAPFSVSGFTTIPTNRLVTQNDSNGTAVVTVPVGPSSTETIVHVTNVTSQGLVKVCKTLAPNAGALANTPFGFNVTDAANGEQLSIVVGSAGGTQCKFLNTGLPLGSTVTVTEQVPNPANFAVDNQTQTITVQPGVNVVSFTNTALGTVEVCKTGADPSARNPNLNYQFSVNGGAAFTVHAGQCSGAIVVPAGRATVAEVNIPANFQLTGVSAVHTDDLSNAIVSGTNPVTVDVRTGNSPANETLVTFTDAVKTGTFKICKVSNEPTLQNIAFNFTFTGGGTAALKPGECSNVSGPLPVVDANGNPTTIDVTEAPTTGTQVSNIAVTGAGALTASNNAVGTSSFTIGIGQTIDTYTNVRTPL